MKQVLVLSGMLAFAGFVLDAAESASPAPTAPLRSAWTRGPWGDDTFFPIAVWLQDPRNAARYREAGINTYVALWNGPTEDQLAALAKAGMKVICHQNAVGLARRESPEILAWMHGDEPDNAQSLGDGKGYGPPILPERIQRDYDRLRATDPTRPILLNLGQGVAWDDYIGRGVRRRHPEDYAEYVKGADIVSFDIYPAVHDSPQVAGRLEFVARGVERLVAWAGSERRVWNCIECTRIGNARVKPTPEQVRSEVWMSLIRGSRGLIYFVHQFAPKFREAALLDDPEMLAAVTSLNAEIRELAPVLNGETIADALSVQSSEEDVPLAVLVKRRLGVTYVFVVSLANRATRAGFTLKSEAMPGVRPVQVLYEDRRLEARNGEWSDAFAPYGVHRYRIGRAE